MKLSTGFVLAIATSSGLFAGSAEPALAQVDFRRDIEPILRDSCVGCHGSDDANGQLRLDSKRLALKGGFSGRPIVPGKPDESLIYRLITEKDPSLRMPQGSDPLVPEKIGLIRAWIEQGAAWPESSSDADIVVEKHWAYVKPVRPAPPEVDHQEWVRNPIDSFVLARLENENITPAPEASRETLIRRLSFDLIGLPPTLEEVDAFLADSSPEAYEKLVDRLLASPHYGERWAEPWLDAARYADSNGHTNDRPRSIWLYRDWVINALNNDMPFDQFTIEQVAGDLLPNATQAQRIATGFHRNSMFNDEQGVDQEEARWNVLVERVGTTATVWLGSTLACAQCHNHKYDPFSQRDFFGLLAFFENLDFTVEGASYNKKYIEPQLDLGSPAERKRRQELEEKVAELKRKKNKTPQEVERQKELSDQLADFLKPYPSTLVLRERASEKPLTTHLRIKGSFLSEGEQVSAATPPVLHPLPADSHINRLTLARWLVDAENPLTARVTVNRHWSQFFGRGIVETVEDFGTRGAAPTHPELLDWLATEFVRSEWSMKTLHKTIVMSSTYRQSSRISPELLERDPYNHLLARGPRFRLAAEQIRDATLAISGLLSRKIGGPSVFPPQPETTSIGDHGGVEWIASEGEDRYRRGLYTFWRRSALYPALMNFDAPSRESCTVQRLRTNTPLQALTLLNDITAREAAVALAKRIQLEAGADEVNIRAAFAFRLCTRREPSANERDMIARHYSRARRLFERDQPSAERIAGEASPANADFAAWFVVSQALLNLDETLNKE